MPRIKWEKDAKHESCSGKQVEGPETWEVTSHKQNLHWTSYFCRVTRLLDLKSSICLFNE